MEPKSDASPFKVPPSPEQLVKPKPTTLPLSQILEYSTYSISWNISFAKHWCQSEVIVFFLPALKLEVIMIFPKWLRMRSIDRNESSRSISSTTLWTDKEWKHQIQRTRGGKRLLDKAEAISADVLIVFLSLFVLFFFFFCLRLRLWSLTRLFSS